MRFCGEGDCAYVYIEAPVEEVIAKLTASTDAPDRGATLSGRRFTPEQIAAGRVLLAELVRRYPAFSYPQRPLATGISSVLKEKLPEADPKVIHAALKLWTTTTRYLNAVQAMVERVDLYGQPAGPVSDADRANAQQWLNVRSVSSAGATIASGVRCSPKWHKFALRIMQIDVPTLATWLPEISQRAQGGNANGGIPLARCTRDAPRARWGWSVNSPNSSAYRGRGGRLSVRSGAVRACPGGRQP